MVKRKPVFSCLSAALIGMFGYHSILSIERAHSAPEYYDVNFADRSCKIPSNYLVFPENPPDHRGYAQVFQVFLPDFTSIPDKPRKLREAQRENRIALSIIKKYPPRDRPALPLSLPEFGDRLDSEAYGLHQMEITKKIDGYFRIEDDVVQTFLSCNHTERAAGTLDDTWPINEKTCRHEFPYSGVRFRLLYGVQHLAQWREIEKKSMKFFDTLCLKE